MVSISELANETGISQIRLEALIEGTLEPTGDEVLIIADYFKCDYKFFISNEKLAPFEETEELFRKHGNELIKEDRNNIKDFLFLCENEFFLEKELNKDVKFKFNFVKRGINYKRHGIEASRQLRDYLKYHNDEVPQNIINDFRKLGVHIFRRKLGKTSISGMYIRHPVADHCILINYDEDVFRQRFSMAHEMGHVILDDDNVSLTLTHYNKTPLSEIRANNFASNYLLPDKLLFNISNNVTWSDSGIIEFSKRLLVNPQTLAIRLYECKIISEADKNTFYKLKLNKDDKIEQEISSNESHNSILRKTMLLEKGLSEYYVDLCFYAYRENIISLGKLKESLLCDDDFSFFEIANIYNQKIEYGN